MAGERPLEPGIRRDLEEELTYSEHLHLDLLLAAQQPLSSRHDELLFIIQHQTSELWMRLLLHELGSARSNLAADRVNKGLKDLARVKHIQRQLFEQWAVLETLTPSEYADFRDLLSQASGFQERLRAALAEPSLPHQPDRRLVEAFGAIYEAREQHWLEYELCEELVDLEESFQLWRFRHLKTVDMRFFPELWDVRTEIGR